MLLPHEMQAAFEHKAATKRGQSLLNMTSKRRPRLPFNELNDFTFQFENVILNSLNKIIINQAAVDRNQSKTKRQS